MHAPSSHSAFAWGASDNTAYSHPHENENLSSLYDFFVVSRGIQNLMHTLSLNQRARQHASYLYQYLYLFRTHYLIIQNNVFVFGYIQTT